ncbi:MAG: hypothetical protein E4H41_08575 [Gemmatimonadales bacterium]|jgi:hypothetical protein|nr:MAG: hypothetical protein E4H41_08575 [Gemmatimonadales bacterium]
MTCVPCLPAGGRGGDRRHWPPDRDLRGRTRGRRLLGSIAESVVLAIVAALAIWELNFARQIVRGAFLIGVGSIGVAFALAVGMGSSQAIREAWQQMFDKQQSQKKEE